MVWPDVGERPWPDPHQGLSYALEDLKQEDLRSAEKQGKKHLAPHRQKAI